MDYNHSILHRKIVDVSYLRIISGWPRGIAVKCARSTAGGPGSDPRHTPMHRLSSHAVAASHIKWRKTSTDVSPGPVFLSKKRRNGMDVSSGLIFLTHTKK